jgi:hypothetical protein
VRPDVQVFLFPEELEATPADALAEQILRLGCDAASVAVVYHRARRVLPRQARVSVLTSATTYFEPERTQYGELAPVANGPLELRERLFEFRKASGRAGLGFRAWIVALHHEALAAKLPAAAARTLDGSPNGVGLCPSAPASVELVAGLVADVCAQLEPEAVELEAALYPAWEPSYNLTLALSPLSQAARLLAAQCFCGACRDLLGDDADELERRARASAGEPFGAGPWDDELEGALVAARTRGVQRLVATATDAAHAHGASMRIFGSGPPRQAALQGLSAPAVAAADRLLLGCGQLAGDELLERFQGLCALVGGRPATASMNWSPDRSAASMAADAERLAAAGADGLALYNLSLVPDEGLEAFRAAAAAFRSAAVEA